MPRHRRLLALFFSLSSVLSMFTPPGARAENYLHVVYPPGYYPTHTQEFTLSEAAHFVFSVSRNYHGGVSFTVNNFASVASSGRQDWSVELAAADHAPITVGDYQNAMRFPFEDPGHPGLDFSGNGEGVNTETGNFQVLDAVFDPDGTVRRFSANFEQHPEGAAGVGVRGELRYENPAPPYQPQVTALNTSPSTGVGMAPGVVTIQRRVSEPTPLAVYYKLIGTAVNGQDYRALKGRATIPANSTSVGVKIKALQTGRPGGLLTVTVKIKARGQPYGVYNNRSASVVIFPHQ